MSCNPFYTHHRKIGGIFVLLKSFLTSRRKLLRAHKLYIFSIRIKFFIDLSMLLRPYARDVSATNLAEKLEVFGHANGPNRSKGTPAVLRKLRTSLLFKRNKKLNFFSLRIKTTSDKCTNT